MIQFFVVFWDCIFEKIADKKKKGTPEGARKEKAWICDVSDFVVYIRGGKVYHNF